ncbi:MAG: hypothetical protein QF824_05300 [Candidatus Woesearchaeota archaeon]|jgi:hypothetical protein|nr:hypothetical protein [Candidatus Woesearchaeota archaeon]|tara:strand:+ start:347 stop:1588 length:1242 start_codon:yes stop_codon:yes gene_type:complete
MRVPYKKHEGFDPLGDCGKGKCPICARNFARYTLKNTVKSENFSSDSNSVFVGHYNYPNVNVGVLAPPELKEDSWLYDAPRYWAQNNYEIPKIVNFRSSLLNNKYASNVLNARKNEKLILLGQELAMASKPAALEVNLKEKPRFRLQTNDHSLPMGPSTDLKKIMLTENPKIPRKIDYVVSDSDLKTTEGIKILYKKDVDENTLTKLFSIGNLGLKKDRRLVPTRWSTTAVHDIVTKNLLNNIKNSPLFDYKAYFGSYLGNYYLLLFFPEIWSYELFETYVSSNTTMESNLKYMTDFEPYEGRKTYAQNCAGGWYSVRMAIAEHLDRVKRQGSCLAIRLITDEYAMPLGVWVTTEATRKALNNKSIGFSSMELMLKYAKIFIKKKFNFDLEIILKNSILLRNMKQQSKLTQFL